MTDLPDVQPQRNTHRGELARKRLDETCLVLAGGFGPDHHLLDAGELAVVAQALIHPDNR